MEESSETTLLNNRKVYYANCPGCKVDRLKETQQSTPYKEFAYIWLVSLCTALPISSLFPFAYFMIRDFDIAKREEDIGFYVGYLGSSFMVGRALTSIFWGVVADRYGRKPVILIGTISVVVFNTLFGFSTSFLMALSMRFLLGCFNSLLGQIRAYASEVCREEYRALSQTIVSTSRGVGLVIGPAIGGFFAQPAEKYPSVFSKNSLFRRFPYLLPCLIISVFAMGVSVASCWLPETLHMHDGNIEERGNSYDILEASSSRSDGNGDEGGQVQGPSSGGSLLKNWPLISTIIVYCVFSLHEMAYTEIFSLWAVSDRKYGGLSFSSQDVGEVLAISGIFIVVFRKKRLKEIIFSRIPARQRLLSSKVHRERLFRESFCIVCWFWSSVISTTLYPPVERYLGPIMVTRLSAVLSIPLLSSYPFIALLSGFSLKLTVNCASILKNVLSVSAVTGLFILQNKAVPQHQRGAANGISMTSMSIFKAFGPAGGGSLFSWAQKRQRRSFLPGDQMVFFMLNLVQLIGVLLTFKPFLIEA